MVEKFGKNKGTYLNRAYAVHDDDKWYYKVKNRPEHAGKFDRAVDKLTTEIIIAEEKKIKKIKIPKEPKRPQPLKARRPSAQTQLKYIERMERYYRRIEKYEQKLEEIAEEIAEMSGNLKEKARDDAETLINKLLTQGTAYDNIAQSMWNGHLGQKDLSILMRRKEIPKEIRLSLIHI